MSPLADAVRFVDREQRNRGTIEQLAKSRPAGPFGCDIEQVERTRRVPLDGFSTIGIDAGQCRRTDADSFGGAQLVVHQGNQRRNYNTCPRQGQGGYLVTERFSRTGRHHGKRVNPCHDPLDYIELASTETGKPKNGLEDGERVRHGRALAVSVIPRRAWYCWTRSSASGAGNRC